MSNTVTIKFRAKLDTFSGGKGYKVPKLTASHISFSERDTRSTLLMQTRDYDIFLRQLETLAVEIPGVVWEDGGGTDFRRDTSAWTVTPIGKGFMADVSITVPFGRKVAA